MVHKVQRCGWGCDLRPIKSALWCRNRHGRKPYSNITHESDNRVQKGIYFITEEYKRKMPEKADKSYNGKAAKNTPKRTKSTMR